MTSLISFFHALLVSLFNYRPIFWFHCPYPRPAPPSPPSSHTANMDKYEGMWMNDMKEGPGRFFYRTKHQIYEGEWAMDVPKCGTLVDVPLAANHKGHATIDRPKMPYVR